MWVQVPLPAQVMKKVDKLIFNSFIRYFFAAFFISFFVVILGLIYDKISLILSKNLESKVYVQILFYIIIFLTPYICIVSSILGTIMCISKLEDNLELTAMKSLGISLRRIYFSLFICSAFTGCFVSVFSHYLSPKYKKKCFDIFRRLDEMDPSVGIKEGIFNNDIPEIGIFVGKKDKGKLREILVYNHRGNADIESLFISDEGKIVSDYKNKVTKISLDNGLNYCEGGFFDNLGNQLNNKNSGETITVRNSFEKQNILINMKNLFSSSSFSTSLSNSVSYEVYKKIKNAEKNIDDRIQELMNNVNNDYKTIFENMSEKNEISLKSKIYDSFNDGDFNNSIVYWADDFKNKYISLFSDVENYKKDIYRYNLEILRRIMDFVACFFLIIIGGFFGFYMGRGKLILPLFIAGFFISLYFLGDSLLANIYPSNYYIRLLKNLGGSLFLFPFFFVCILKSIINVKFNIFSFIRRRRVNKIINNGK